MNINKGGNCKSKSIILQMNKIWKNLQYNNCESPDNYSTVAFREGLIFFLGYKEGITPKSKTS